MKSTIIISILLITLSSCKKNPFDYRSKYIGKWEFTYSHYATGPGSAGSPDQDFQYKGSIEYGDEDDGLLIKYGEGRMMEVGVDKDGNLHHKLGTISRKKLNIQINDGSPGYYFSMKLTGKRVR